MGIRLTHEEAKVIKSKDAKVLWVMSTLGIEMQKHFLLQLNVQRWKYFQETSRFFLRIGGQI